MTHSIKQPEIRLEPCLLAGRSTDQALHRVAILLCILTTQAQEQHYAR